LIKAGALLAVWEQDFGNDHPATLNADLFKRVCDSTAETLGTSHPKFLQAYELLGIVYGNYAEVQGNLESAEKCYKRGLCSKEKQFDENHPRMVKISVILERLNKSDPRMIKLQANLQRKRIVRSSQ